MHRWILYGNVYQRHMNYTPSWNIETKVGGGLMDAFKYFFVMFLFSGGFVLLLWFRVLQSHLRTGDHRKSVSICWMKEQPITRSDGQWVNPFLSFGYFVFSSPFVIVCSHLCCIVSTCVSSPMATVCARPPLLSDGLFAFHLFDLKQPIKGCQFAVSFSCTCSTVNELNYWISQLHGITSRHLGKVEKTCWS